MKKKQHDKPAKQPGTATKASGADQHAGDHTRTGVRDRIASLKTPGSVEAHRNPAVAAPSTCTNLKTLGGNVQ